MRTISANKLATELIRYYQQKDALETQLPEYEKLNNLKGYNTTMAFYNDKINSLKVQLHETDSERLSRIEEQREANKTVTEAKAV